MPACLIGRWLRYAHGRGGFLACETVAGVRDLGAVGYASLRPPQNRGRPEQRLGLHALSLSRQSIAFVQGQAVFGVVG